MMPHLMNCAHSPDGWCLDCVKKLWEETRAAPLLDRVEVVEALTKATMVAHNGIVDGDLSQLDLQELHELSRKALAALNNPTPQPQP